MDLLIPDGLELVTGSLLWSAVPLIVAIYTAGRRELVIWPAAVLALFGGWLGLFLVILFYKEPLVDRASRSGESARYEGGRTDYLFDESSARLRTLNRLLDEGLIGPEEYERKRREVLETI